MTVVIFAPDLIDRSKLASRFPDAELVGSPAALAAMLGGSGTAVEQAGAGARLDLVIVDLSRAGVLDALADLGGANGPRLVGFAPHVDDATFEAARDAGVEALPRSVFFRRLEQGDLVPRRIDVDSTVPQRFDVDSTQRAARTGDLRGLLARTAELAADHLDTLVDRSVGARTNPDQLRFALGGPLPEDPVGARRTVEDLVDAAAGGLVASNGPRYFGFVTGGSLPAALAADWLTAAWDQNVALGVMSPAAAVAEEVVGGWLADLLGLPPTVSFGLVTGAQMANVVGLAAARHYVLARQGIELERVGLAGAPPLRILVGAQRHVTVDVALRYLGIGTDQVTVVDADQQGRLRPDALRDALDRLGDGPTIVCAQAGCVSTGAFDPFEAIVAAAHRPERWAWVHVDGAFGLWAAASPQRRWLTEGVSGADSWAADGHKWLNVPYDSGFAFTAHPDAHQAAMAMQAAYLVRGRDALRDGSDWAPESSRRARAFPTWAALRSLGRHGVADLVERGCRLASAVAVGLSREPGVEVLNDVVLNQVLVSFGDDARTAAVIAAVQRSGIAWFGGTTWAGRPAARISVSGWSTTEDDIERLVDAIAAAIAAVRTPPR